MVRSRSSLSTRTMGNSQQGGNPSKRQRGRAHECRSHNLTETVSTEWEITGQSASEKSDSQPGIYRYRRKHNQSGLQGNERVYPHVPSKLQRKPQHSSRRSRQQRLSGLLLRETPAALPSADRMEANCVGGNDERVVRPRFDQRTSPDKSEARI